MEAVSRFLAAARRYREVIDDAESHEVPDFARAARNALAQAYLAASMLPKSAPTSADVETPARDGTAWEALFRRVDKYLGATGVYHAVFDATELQEDDPVEVFLADDLAEIYFDLGAAIELLERPAWSADALWEVSFTFENHWGSHAVDALRPLHRLRRLG